MCAKQGGSLNHFHDGLCYDRLGVEPTTYCRHQTLSSYPEAVKARYLKHGKGLIFDNMSSYNVDFDTHDATKFSDAQLKRKLS